MQSNKLELVARRCGDSVILAGVMLTENFKAHDLAAMQMFGRVDGDEITVVISKEQYQPKNEFGETFELDCLSSMPTQEVWRRYQSTDPREFGGVVIGRDNFLFDFEDSEKTSRMAIVSVIQDKANILRIDDHAVFRSVESSEYQECYEFKLKQDTTDETRPLIEKLRGDGLLSFYRKPFFTLPDGSPYRLSTVMPQSANELHCKQYKEIMEFGDVTVDTRQLMQAHRLLTHTDTDYIIFVKEIGLLAPTTLDKFSRLLTETEHNENERIATEFLRAQMEA
ncbi:hypothetical protein LMH73_019285 [Vibrio splendidus]|nr:hypothetical protein [Vibrio splendidus]MCC4883017.1 hypothetical protein [Vibrio splendidus]